MNLIKRHWIILVFASIGWVALIIAQIWDIDILRKVGDSFKTILTTITFAAILIPVFDGGFEAIKKVVQEAIPQVILEFKNGFSQLVDATQKVDVGSELRDVRKYLPHQIKYLQHSRTFYLESNGNEEVLIENIIKNISDRKLNRIILPILAFTITDYDENKNYDQLIELKIDGKQVDIDIDTIRTKYHRATFDFLKRLNQPHMIECCYRIPVDLEPNQTVHIVLRLRYMECAITMYDEDYIGARTYDITEKLIIAIVPPENHIIQIVTTAELCKGFKVFHIATEDVQPDELIRLARPDEGGGKKIHWTVEFPLIGYAYAVHYKVVKSKSST